MRVLLDECLPRRLKAELPDHEVQTVQEQGWAGKKNGALQVAAGRFNVLLTVDRNIAFQQNLRGLNIGVLAMVVPSNRFVDIRPLMAQVRRALPKVRAGQVLRVGINRLQATVGVLGVAVGRDGRAPAACDEER